jgi:hypothetical protein
VAHLSQYMPLLSQAEIRGKDVFTGLDLVSIVSPVNTYLLYDTTLTPQQGIVTN